MMKYRSKQYHFQNAVALLSLCLFACLTACQSTAPVREEAGEKWIAFVSLSPNGAVDDNIGLFDNEADCLAAVKAWLSRQVVGVLVSGRCLNTKDVHLKTVRQRALE